MAKCVVCGDETGSRAITCSSICKRRKYLLWRYGIYLPFKDRMWFILKTKDGKDTHIGGWIEGGHAMTLCGRRYDNLFHSTRSRVTCKECRDEAKKRNVEGFKVGSD